MALISDNLYIGEIGNRIKLIRDPGRDNETVLFIFDLTNKVKLNPIMYWVQTSRFLTTEEKLKTTFWLGYFYAHSVRPLPHRDPQEKEGKVVSDFTVENVEALKADVIKILVSTYDMSMEEAAEAVEEGYRNDPDNWHENALAEQLASALADVDTDE